MAVDDRPGLKKAIICLKTVGERRQREGKVLCFLCICALVSQRLIVQSEIDATYLYLPFPAEHAG
jgi:hypothetical protein